VRIKLLLSEPKFSPTTDPRIMIDYFMVSKQNEQSENFIQHLSQLFKQKNVYLESKIHRENR
jgi:hypothetical protein